MCTLTFIPLDEHWIITSNRDEFHERADVLFPVLKEIKNKKVWFPREPLAGGTWIATTETGDVRVLLNGALEKHDHRPPYRKSRGLVLLDSYESSDLVVFSEEYDLEGIEPFTMIQFWKERNKIIEFIWDGQYKYLNLKDSRHAYIWSSVTLYPPEVIEAKTNLFSHWLDNNVPLPENLLEFHQFEGKGKSKPAIRARFSDELSTVSISQAVVSNDSVFFLFKNLLKEEEFAIELGSAHAENSEIGNY